jgi:hypothetical protein
MGQGAAAEQLLAQKESNIYRYGAFEPDDQARIYGKHVGTSSTI